MGQKVNPLAFRLPLHQIEMWRSRWFTTDPKRYRTYLGMDIKLREALMKKLSVAGVTRVDVERSIRSMRVIVYVTRPGVVIGRGGSGLEDLKKFIYQTLNISLNDKKAPRIDLQVEEIKEPDLSAYLVGTKIAEQLVRRIPARRAVNKTIERSMASGAKGVKVLLSGRVGGAEIARHESYRQGSVPLQTLRADVDYAHVPALTRSGYVGVKVWIYRGEKH